MDNARTREWSRYDEMGLALHVTPEAGSGISLSLDRKAKEKTAEGRRAIVQDIYETLVTKGIRYASEPYHPSDALQRIRTAEAIFDDREGTCLDLAVLFCGICLHFDLLPYLIVFEDHAIAAVATTHGLADWNAARPARALFDQGPVSEIGQLRTLVQNDLLLAVECTGFAHSEYLSNANGAQKYPETLGREDGVMTFARSVAAGAEQLQSVRRLRFALDIAVAHFAWRMSPPETALRSSRNLRGLSLQEDVRDFVDYYLGTTDAPAPFGGRSKEIKLLNDWLAADRPFGIVLAPAGKGKSALLVHWVTQLTASQSGPHVTFFPISVRYQTNQALPALRTIAAVLAACHGDPSPDSQEIDQLRASIKGYLRRTPPDGRALILVLDGLDEAANWTIDRSLFPWVKPRKVKVLLATRPLAGDAENNQLLALLGISRAQVTFFALGSLGQNGIVEVLALRGPQLSEEEKVALAKRLLELTEGDPLLLRLYLDELDLSRSSSGEVLQRLRGRAVGIDGYMKLWCDEQSRLRGVNPLEDNASRTLLDLCAHALGPLSTSDIVALGQETLSSSQAIQKTVRVVDRLLIGDGKVTGYVFTHPRLAEYMRGLMTSQEQAGWERRFLDYGRATLARLDESRLGPADVSPYLLRYFCAHLRRSAPAELGSLLSLSWLRAWEGRSGAVSGFLDDLNLAWEDAKSRGEAGLLIQVKAALYSSTLSSTVQQVPAIILEAALRNKLISPIKALSLARRHASTAFRCHSLAVVVPFLPDEEQQDEVWKEWLELLPLVPTREGERTGCFRYHLNKIPAKFTPQLIDVTKRTEDRTIRIGMLCSLLQRLTGEELQKTIDRIFGEIETAPRLAYLYPELIAIFPDEHVGPVEDRALEYVLSDEVPLWNRARVLARLVSVTKGAQRDKFLQMAIEAARNRELTDDRDRARSLLHIFPLLPGAPSKADQKKFIRSISSLDDHEQNNYLRALSDKLTGTVVSENWFYLTLVMDLELDSRAALALHLPEPNRSKYFREAWDKIRTRNDGKGMGQLTFLFKRVPPEWKSTLSAEVMDFFRANVAVLSSDSNEESVFDLYEYFPDEVYELVRRHIGSSFRASWACLVSQRFRPEHEEGLVRVAWEQSRVVSDSSGIVKVLAAFLPRLAESERMAIAQSILSGPYAHSLEDSILPVLEIVGAKAVREWLLAEPPESRGDMAIKIACRQPAEVRALLQAACISRSNFRAASNEAPEYGIDYTVTVTDTVLVQHLPDPALPSLVRAVMERTNEKGATWTITMIHLLASRLSAPVADSLADWIYDAWDVDSRVQFSCLARLLPVMSGDHRRTFAEVLLDSAEEAATTGRAFLNNMIAALVEGIPQELMPRLLEVVNDSDSEMNRAELLRRIGEKLPNSMVTGFFERCEELVRSIVTVVEARSSMAQHMSKEEKDGFVSQARAQVMAVDYAPDRVRAVYYLGAFCDPKTQRELWNEVMGTDERETEYLSSGELGLSVSPKLDFYAAVAEKGPSWLLLRCLEAGAASADSFHSDDVVDEVLNRWAEVRILGRAEEIRALSMVLRRGVTRGRSVLAQNLQKMSVSFSPEQTSALVTTLQEINQISD